MSDPIEDKALDEYLQRSSSLSQHYRELGAEEAPQELDRRVLMHARDAVARRSARSRAWMRWSAPLALAASAVLVVSIVLESGVQEEVVYAPKPREIPEEESRWIGETVPENAAGSSNEVVPQELPAAAAPPPMIEAPAAPAPVKAAPVRPDSVQSAADAVEQPKEITITARRRESREESSRGMTASSAAMDERSEPRMAAPQSTAVTQTAIRRQSAETMWRQADADPERWLEEIRELRKEGKPDEADREWERFRESFPDYPVANSDIARKDE